MMTLLKRLVIVSSIIFGWVILMFLGIKEQIGGYLSRACDQIYSISGININYKFGTFKLVTDFWGQAKDNSNLQILLFILILILFEELALRISAMRK